MQISERYRLHLYVTTNKVQPNKQRYLPQQAILYALITETIKWKVNGDQIIIMDDINAYAESKEIKDFFDSIGTRELMIERHGKTGKANTRGNRSGKEIYGIWGTREVNIVTGSYLPFHVCVGSDHRILWTNISHEYIFEYTAPKNRILTAQNQRMNNPVSQRKYLLTVKKILKANNIRERLKTITDKAIFTTNT